MMKELYSSDDVKRLKKRMRGYSAVCIALAAVAVGVGIATCFLITDENANMLKTIDIVLSSACGCVALYLISNCLIPVRARKNYIEKMLYSPAKSVYGRVASQGKKVTLVKYIDLSELRIVDENGRESILYSDNDTDVGDLEGRVVEFKVVNNKIVGYGDAQ